MSRSAKPVAGVLHPVEVHFSWPRLSVLKAVLASWRPARRQRRTTIELSSTSPHLLRDIGLAEHYVRTRRP